MRNALWTVLVIAACDSGAQPVTDAAPAADATRVPIDGWIVDSRVPFSTTGTTPLGTLEPAKFISVNYLHGFCEPGWYIRLERANDSNSPEFVHLSILAPPDMQPATGTLPAIARLYDDRSEVAAMTNQVKFDVTIADLPPTEPMRLVGRIYVDADGWQFDFPIDATMPEAITCI